MFQEGKLPYAANLVPFVCYFIQISTSALQLRLMIVMTTQFVSILWDSTTANAKMVSRAMVHFARVSTETFLFVDFYLAMASTTYRSINHRFAKRGYQDSYMPKNDESL